MNRLPVCGDGYGRTSSQAANPFNLNAEIPTLGNPQLF